MLIKLTTDMTESEKLAAQNSNNQYLLNRWYTEVLEDVTWTCKKSEDGIAECNCQIPYEIANVGLEGRAMITNGENIRPIFPISFIEKPIVTPSLQDTFGGTQWISLLQIRPDNTRIASIFISAPSESTVSGVLNLRVIGRWK